MNIDIGTIVPLIITLVVIVAVLSLLYYIEVLQAKKDMKVFEDYCANVEEELKEKYKSIPMSTGNKDNKDKKKRRNSNGRKSNKSVSANRSYN